MTTVNNAGNWLLELLIPQINNIHLEDSCHNAIDVYNILLMDDNIAVHL